MYYILDFCVVSFAFLLLVTLSYFSQRRVKTLRSRLYGFLLILGLLSIAFDFVCALLDRYPGQFSPLLLTVLNIVFLACVQGSGITFLYYSMILTGRYFKIPRFVRMILHLPYAAILVLLVSALFTRNAIFYIDDAGNYQAGPLHMALYAAIAFYLIASISFVVANRKTISRRRRLTIYSFVSVTIVCMLIHTLSNGLLINTSGYAFALLIMYFTLQLPNRNIDALTKIFNVGALDEIVIDYFDQAKPFSVVLFPLASFRVINHVYGTNNGDLVLTELARRLNSQYPESSVVRVSGEIFAVISEMKEERELTKDTLYNMLARFAYPVQVENTEIAIESSAIGLRSADFNSLNEVLDAVKYVIQDFSKNDGVSEVILMDEEYKEKLVFMRKVEGALENALRLDMLMVYYQPIHDTKGRLVALEALCRLKDEELGFIRPDIFIAVAERNGSIFKLTEQVLDKVCRFINECNVDSWHLEHIGVNLSIMQFMQAPMAEAIIRIINEHDIKPGVLRFELTETESASSLSRVRENMKRLIDRGFSFLLDDFGSGYANFNYLSELPFYCVKLDKTLLWNCDASAGSKAALDACNDIIKRLGLLTVCEGVETKEQVELLTDMGINMLQGFYFSKPIPENELLEYVGRLEEVKA